MADPFQFAFQQKGPSQKFNLAEQAPRKDAPSTVNDRKRSALDTVRTAMARGASREVSEAAVHLQEALDKSLSPVP